jgi:glycosyltransferase involved in cell wall biosynthesis
MNLPTRQGGQVYPPLAAPEATRAGQSGPPVVSAIIPAYNSEDFIAETLDSVFAQTYRPVEIIIVDDGSTDRTADIVKNYQAREDNETKLMYIYQQNSGPSNARNTGIQSATGKYIAFLDADDLWPEDKLRKQTELLEVHQDVVLIFGDVRRFSKSKGIAESMFTRQKCTKEFFGDFFYVKDAYRKLLIRNFIPTGTVMIRKKYFQNGLFFDESFRHVEDLDLWLRIAMNNAIAYSTGIWEFKRDHDKNLSNNAETMMTALINVIEKHSGNFQPFLKENKINLKKYISDGYLGLGFYYLNSGHRQKAKKAFLKSFYNKIRMKSIYYFFTAFFNHQNHKKIGHN